MRSFLPAIGDRQIANFETSRTMANLLRYIVLALFTAIASCNTVEFALNLTWATGAPDGNSRQMVFMNGQFPGPQLSLNQGDSVEVRVKSFEQRLSSR